MPANTTPIFGLVANVGRARLTAAITASDGSGSPSTLFTAASNGSIVTRIRYANSQATAALSSAMVVRIFITDNAGANPRLWMEFSVAAATRTTAVKGVGDYIDIPGGLVLKTGQLLLVAQSVYAGVQDQMDYIAEGMDY